MGFGASTRGSPASSLDELYRQGLHRYLRRINASSLVDLYEAVENMKLLASVEA